MSKEQLQQRVAKVEAELAELKAELNKPEKDEWPKEGDKYYFLCSDGDVSYSIFDCTLIDEGRESIGNIFSTKEEAEHRLEQLKLIHELREFGGDEGDYHLWYIITANGWTCDIGYTGLVQFPSKGKAEEAISHFGDRLNILLPKK